MARISFLETVWKACSSWPEVIAGHNPAENEESKVVPDLPYDKPDQSNKLYAVGETESRNLQILGPETEQYDIDLEFDTIQINEFYVSQIIKLPSKNDESQWVICIMTIVLITRTESDTRTHAQNRTHVQTHRIGHTYTHVPQVILPIYEH